MADVVLSPLLQVVFEKLANSLLEQLANRSGSKGSGKLHRTLWAIQAVLHDAEEQQFSDRALRFWLAELKQVAYDVEDFLDDFSPEAIFPSHHGSFSEQVLNLVPSMAPFFISTDLLSRVTQIRETLEFLAEERSSFHLREGFVKRDCRRRSKRETGSYIIESEVLGREEDRERIVKLLLSPDDKNQRDISVVSIVGLGGLGKTTLAQLLYNDDSVTGHFDMKIWACVNDDFCVENIIMSIIESAGKVSCDLSKMDMLQFRLKELLSGKRYLLVLDDVWNEDEDEWDKLRTSLRGSTKGSTIIVTTRSEKVASIMGSTCIHHLKGLPDDDCWGLFRQRAFGDNVDGFANLFLIGKRIVQKCGGIPLAAKTLGSLMRFKRDEREWFLVHESNLWDLCERENGILPALRLSYSHLPSHLKACFAYCSLFPRNYIIQKDKLIQLWIAEGLIQSPEGRKSLEYIGNEYFDDLVWIFFFQDIQKGDNGSITECKMHDLIHDLAQSVAGREYVVLESDRTTVRSSEIRHASVVRNFGLHVIPEALHEAKKLRTIILLSPKGDLGEAPINEFLNFRYLRVLDLSGCGLKRLNASISSFIFLRYLDLSYTHVNSLPDTVCGLNNLRVMNLSGCYNLTSLPNDLTNMPKLRHLIIKGCDRLMGLPPFIGKLLYLRTLSWFIVRTEQGQSISELGTLNLAGMLQIKHLENVLEAEEAMRADIIGKRNLQSLSLSWGNNLSSVNSGMVEQVLSCLQPHEYLKKLSITEYQGIQFPRWMAFCKLPNLTELVLVNCRRCEHLPALGQLPYLKVLHLQGMDSVKIIGVQFHGETREGAFPSLKELMLTEFPCLESWWSFNRREDFPSLAKLIINKCSRLKNIPCFPKLQHLELPCCNNMMVQSASDLTSLTTLVVDECADLVFLDKPLQNNTLLNSLVISSCPKLASISSFLVKLRNLKSLTIRWCSELRTLPRALQDLTLLESLEIIECHSLVSLPEDMHELRSLRSLSIENCDNLTSLPSELQFLMSLENLTIMYCPHLASLPENLEHLCALRSLSILNCPMLVSLPEGLQHVTTLQNLEIHSCPGLKELPGWLSNLSLLRSLTLSGCPNITSLPQGMQRLSCLQHLSIRECPSLEERCRRVGGEDKAKIDHIAHIYIGSHESRSCTTTSSSSA